MSGNASQHIWVVDASNPRGGYWQKAKGIPDGSICVSDGQVGILRKRFITVTGATLPILATSGALDFGVNGAVGVTIDSIRWMAGAIAAATLNPVIRYAIDAPSDAAAALIVPTAVPTSSATTEVGQARSFCVTPLLVAADAFHVFLPTPIPVDVSEPIRYLHFAHNLGTTTGVTIQIGVSAVEVL